MTSPRILAIRCYMQCFFIRLVVNMQEQVREIYSFFGGGEKKEGKSSFADMGLGVGEAVCKCAFTVAVGFLVCFVSKVARNIK